MDNNNYEFDIIFFDNLKKRDFVIVLIPTFALVRENKKVGVVFSFLALQIAFIKNI